MITQAEIEADVDLMMWSVKAMGIIRYAAIHRRPARDGRQHPENPVGVRLLS